MSPGIFGPPVAAIDPRLYEEIVGHPCDHAFKRGGFCRESFGMVGCGRYGEGVRYQFRNQLIEEVYRAYLRVPDKGLARATYDLIDQSLPIQSRRDARGPRFRTSWEAERCPDEPEAILSRGLSLVRTATEWRQLLDAAVARDTSLHLLQDRSFLAQRLADSDVTVRLRAMDTLAGMNHPDAWAEVATCLKDQAMRERASFRIVSARYFPLFEAVVEAAETSRSPNAIGDPEELMPSLFNDVISNLKPEEIRTLFEQGRPRVDRICLAAIRQQNRFEFLDEVLVLVNQRPSRAAVKTIESLIEGPRPYGFGFDSKGKSRNDPWSSIKQNTTGGFHEGVSRRARETHQILQKIVFLGRRPDPANWPVIRDLRQRWISEGANELHAAAFAQAMAECDHEKTLALLANELDPREDRYQQTLAALGGLGLIADQRSVPVLEKFQEKSRGSSFEKNSYHRGFLEFALHRCRQIHRWRLVKNADSPYSVEKPAETAQSTQ